MEKGCLLNEAWLELSEFSIDETLQYKLMFRAFSNKPKEGCFKKEKGIYEEYEPRDLGERLIKRHKLRIGLENKLRGHLEDGELIAIGYMIYPELRELPELIPDAYFKQVRLFPESFYWDDNLFEGKSAHYQKVRVINPKSTDNELDDDTPKPGRPSKACLIEQAYKELKSENKIDFNAFQKNAIHTIQDRLEEKYPGDFKKRNSGFGKEAVRKVIVDDFNANSLK